MGDMIAYGLLLASGVAGLAVLIYCDRASAKSWRELNEGIQRWADEQARKRG